MTAFVLNDWQVHTLLELGDVGEPVPGSPLRAIRRNRRPLAPREPDFDALASQGLVVHERRKWRVNSVIAGVLRACAQPDEVINIGIGDLTHPGFVVVRRGGLVTECTVGRGGLTKLSFPVSRSSLLLMLIGALSGEDGTLADGSFHFRGRVDDAFALGTALREWRGGHLPLTVDGLKAAVVRDARAPQLTAGFVLLGEREAMEKLGANTRRADAAVKRLVADGHLEANGTTLEISAEAAAALGDTPAASFSITHAEFTAGGASTRVLQAIRTGNRILVLRPVHRHGHPAELDWMEVSRRQLRALVAAMVLPTDELDAVVSGRPLTTQAEPKVAAAAASTNGRSRARRRAEAASPEPAAPVWAPTHAVPSSGLAAWSAPDASQAPVATLDPSLQVQVDERSGAWSHIVCSNGWSAWVDGRRLEEL